MEQKNHPINQLLQITTDSLKSLTEENIICGKPITYNNISVIPISTVKCGFLSGGLDQNKKYDYDGFNPFGGLSGGSVSVTPIAFLAILEKEVRVLQINNSNDFLSKTIDFIQGIINKIIKNINIEK